MIQCHNQVLSLNLSFLDFGRCFGLGHLQGLVGRKRRFVASIEISASSIGWAGRPEIVLEYHLRSIGCILSMLNSLGVPCKDLNSIPLKKYGRYR